MTLAPFSFLLNYVSFGLSGVAVDFLTLRRLFPLRRVPVLWWCYFGIKAFVDANLWYAIGNGAASAWVELFQAIWLFAMGILSFVIVYLSFDGDFVLVGMSAVLCDLYASLCSAFGLYLSTLVTDAPLESHLAPLGPYTIVNILGIVGACLLTRPLITQLLHWVCKKAKRNPWAWGLAAFCTAFAYLGITQRLSSYLSLSGYLSMMGPIVVVLVVAIGFMLAQGMRGVRGREKAVATCAALALTYEQTVRTKLDSLEQDLAVLEGHDKVLRELEAGDMRMANQIDRLEDAYQRLRAGAYCDRPVIDAVLTTGARRLHELGARTSLTVANVPSQLTIAATVVLTLLNLACEAAERTGDVQDDEVELRIRSVGEQVVMRLGVPERWGMLWARRYLMPFQSQGVALVRERRQGNRRVVLVICG